MSAAAILSATVTVKHPCGAITKSQRDLRAEGHVVAHLIAAATAAQVQAAIFDLEMRYPRIEARGPWRSHIGWLATARTFGLTGEPR
jgi:hypothetical protein